MGIADASDLLCILRHLHEVQHERRAMGQVEIKQKRRQHRIHFCKGESSTLRLETRQIKINLFRRVFKSVSREEVSDLGTIYYFGKSDSSEETLP